MTFYPSRRGALVLGAALCLAVAGTGAPLATAAEGGEVTIEHFAFHPANLTVAKGARVEWINRDETPHTILGAGQPAAFKSPALDTGDKFAFVFDKPGSYKYFCSIHPQMVGTILVK
jgi:plastocyanin